MISKISFSRLMKEDFKRRSWFIAVVGLLLFILQPVLLLMQVDRYQANIAEGYASLADLQAMYQNFVAIGGSALTVLFMFFAVVSAISGFSYLHSKVKLDFYHSLAIKRRRMFWVQYISGFLMIAIPYTVSLLLNLIIGATNGLMTKAVLVLAIQAYLYRLLCFLAIYAIVILAVELTGKIIVAFFGTAVFILYGVILVGTIIGLSTAFFSTYMELGISSEIMIYSSPAILCFVQEGMISEALASGKSEYILRIWVNMGVIILETLAITGLALWAHNNRKSEAAGSSIAFRKSESVIKVMLVIPLSLLVGLWFAMMISNHTSLWLYSGIIVGTVVISAVIEFIYHTNMREILKDKLRVLIMGIVAIAIATVFKIDLLGYDSYLPAKENIKQMAVYDSSLDGNYIYRVNQRDNFGIGNDHAALNATLTEDFDHIYEIAKTGVEQVNQDPGKQNSTYIRIEYVLNSGRKVYRSYSIDVETVAANMNPLLADQSYKEKLFPLYGKDMEVIQGIGIEGFGGTYDVLDLNKEERAELTEIYKEELLNADYDEIINNTLATLYFEYTLKQNGSYTEERYPIGESFTKTIAYIEAKQEQKLQTELDPSLIEMITIERSDGIKDYSDDFRSRQDIEEIISCAKRRSRFGSHNNAEEYMILIHFTNGNGSYDEFYFEEGNLPSCIQ